MMLLLLFTAMHFLEENSQPQIIPKKCIITYFSSWRLANNPGIRNYYHHSWNFPNVKNRVWHRREYCFTWRIEVWIQETLLKSSLAIKPCDIIINRDPSTSGQIHRARKKSWNYVDDFLDGEIMSNMFPHLCKYFL